LLAAAVLAIALFGVILARNVYRGDSLSVSYIQEEANREAFTLYIDEVWNQGNVDVLGDVAAEGIIYHDTTLAEDVVGVQGVSALITNYRAAMLDFTYSIDSMTADEDRVWAQITASGTHTSALELPDGVSIPASMNTATWSVTVVSQFEDGKIVETWIQADSLGFMQQIGIMPTLQEQTTEAQNIEHVRTFYETIEAREYEDPAYEELFAPTFIWHDPNSSEVYTLRPRDSVNSLRGTERAFPDFRNTIHHISAVGDAVMVHWTFTGTFEEAWNPGRGVCQPTHEEVAYEGIDIFRLEEGVIAEWWTYWDNPFVIDPEENCGER
jgi:steroid delta-isomerase-like uncharacterized protein